MIASHQLSSNLEKEEVVVKRKYSTTSWIFRNKEYFFQSDKLSYNVGVGAGEG